MLCLNLSYRYAKRDSVLVVSSAAGYAGEHGVETLHYGSRLILPRSYRALPQPIALDAGAF